jgi:hypothetical protein
MSIFVIANTYKENFVKMKVTNTYNTAMNGTICGLVMNFYKRLNMSFSFDK